MLIFCRKVYEFNSLLIFLLSGRTIIQNLSLTYSPDKDF